MTSISSQRPAPADLRNSMVDRIIKAGYVAPSAAVERAMRAVPRHEFVPHVEPVDAYASSTVVTKVGPSGRTLSCASEPGIVAMMLNQLAVQPGDRVLEIGAGSGYNAALLAELTGQDGSVTTVDVDPEVAAWARRSLDAAGYGHVSVLTRDGSLGAAEHAPYDRVIFTVGAWDLPPALWEQLTDGGQLVVPLRWRGQTRSIGFVRHTEVLRSESVELCGFVPMLGPLQDGECSAAIDDGGLVTLHWDVGQSVDPGQLHGVLETERHECWAGIEVGNHEPVDGVWLQLAANDSRTCRFAAAREAIDAGLCTPVSPVQGAALVDGRSLAYCAYRRLDGGVVELGAIGHGPAGSALAQQICAQIRLWSHDRTAQPVIIVQPVNTATTADAASTITKPHSRVTIAY